MAKDLTIRRVLFRVCWDALGYVEWSTDGGDYWAGILDSVTDVLVICRHEGKSWAPMVNRSKAILEKARMSEQGMEDDAKASFAIAERWLAKCEAIPGMAENMAKCSRH